MVLDDAVSGIVGSKAVSRGLVPSEVPSTLNHLVAKDLITVKLNESGKMVRQQIDVVLESRTTLCSRVKKFLLLLASRVPVNLSDSLGQLLEHGEVAIASVGNLPEKDTEVDSFLRKSGRRVWQCATGHQGKQQAVVADFGVATGKLSVDGDVPCLDARGLFLLVCSGKHSEGLGSHQAAH